jgi:hypothetical protein
MKKKYECYRARRHINNSDGTQSTPKIASASGKCEVSTPQMLDILPQKEPEMGGKLLRIISFLFILPVKIRTLRSQKPNPAVISLGGPLTGRTTSISRQPSTTTPMRVTIGVGSRVAARRGPLEDPKPGKVRQERTLKFGRVAESVGFNE